MNIGRVLGTLVVAVGVPALAAVALSTATAREPLVLPTVGSTYAASYDAVWDATLKSLGVLKLPVADKADGRIETEAFTFPFVVGGSQNGNTQVIWVALRITLSRVADGTVVQVEPRIEDSLLSGFTPGPTNNPWGDLFARIRQHLGIRG